MSGITQVYLHYNPGTSGEEKRGMQVGQAILTGG